MERLRSGLTKVDIKRKKAKPVSQPYFVHVYSKCIMSTITELLCNNSELIFVLLKHFDVLFSDGYFMQVLVSFQTYLSTIFLFLIDQFHGLVPCH